jgi:2-polyprenyl-3-methyl-5-hydroxy-6-metoxy-1,4-benzoquinol methylase
MRWLEHEWEKFGRRDPYFGVLSEEKFRANQLDAAARAEFFASGERHVDACFETIRRCLAPAFSPRRALDFGCGVGRLVIPLARRCAAVVGADVSASMLAEARRNCDQQGLADVSLVETANGLGSVPGTFDFIHSFIVFQHIPAPKGEQLLAELLDRLEPGGIGALHFTTAQRAPAMQRFVRRLRWSAPVMHELANLLKGRPGEPLMIMEQYDLGHLWNALQEHGCEHAHLRATDHGGHLGVMIFFERRGLGSL